MSNTVLDKLRYAGQSSAPPPRGRSLGETLVDAGRITPAEAEAALRLQREEGLRFGEACVRLGLVAQADIDRALAGQFNYPHLRPGEGGFAPELVAAYAPSSSAAEQLRALRAELLYWFHANHKVLAVCSPGRGDGRSYLAANLAVVFAQLGEDTLLIDADLRAPRQHKLFNLPNRTGLSSMLAGRAGMEVIARVPQLGSLSVLCAGAVPPNPVELLSRPEFEQLLEQLSTRYEVVLIDTPAAEVGVDARTVAVSAGGALLLARRGHTRVKALRALATSIATGRAELVGSVLRPFAAVKA